MILHHQVCGCLLGGALNGSNRHSVEQLERGALGDELVSVVVVETESRLEEDIRVSYKD